jgi:2,5-diketo-D-gluconate reductase A
MAKSTSTIPTVTLNNGVEIPQLGFGVFQIDPADTKRAALAALEVGYRHIDTAEMYRNEAEVGQAVRESAIERSEIFVTSKLNNGFHRPDQVRRAFRGTLEALDIDYVDLFLIHWPLPMIDVDYLDTWKAMEGLLDGGKVRAVGVSNFQPAHLQRLIDEATVVPAVNQIEIHPYLTQDSLTETTASPPKPGHLSHKAGCSMIRLSPPSPQRLTAARPKSCFAGTCSAARLSFRSRSLTLASRRISRSLTSS